MNVVAVAINIYPILLVVLQFSKVLSKKLLLGIIAITSVVTIVLLDLRSKYPICSHEANVYLDYILVGTIIITFSAVAYFLKKFSLNKLLGIEDLLSNATAIKETTDDLTNSTVFPINDESITLNDSKNT